MGLIECMHIILSQIPCMAKPIRPIYWLDHKSTNLYQVLFSLGSNISLNSQQVKTDFYHYSLEI